MDRGWFVLPIGIRAAYDILHCIWEDTNGSWAIIPGRPLYYDMLGKESVAFVSKVNSVIRGGTPFEAIN